MGLALQKDYFYFNDATTCNQISLLKVALAGFLRITNGERGGEMNNLEKTEIDRYINSITILAYKDSKQVLVDKTL